VGREATIFVGDVEELAIGADVELLGVAAALEHFDDFALGDVVDADAVGTFVGGREAVLIDAGAGDGGAA
jgi:hypothetical protein